MKCDIAMINCGDALAVLFCGDLSVKKNRMRISLLPSFTQALAFLWCIACAPALALDLRPIDSVQWSALHVKHLASRAGFGISSIESDALAQESPEAVVHKFITGAFNARAPQISFFHSGIFDVGLDPFPPSRPATTRMAKKQGHALGIRVKPGGNRPLQPIVDKFFYWLRASRLETDRVVYWWANRMLSSGHPLREKMALFWHGHFASNEDKVRDYRKMLKQLQLFQRLGLGDFRELLIKTSQDPAMLVFLDAGVNTKDSPNENFAREIMEMFTLGDGQYTERDVREAARAFTGWNYRGLRFQIVDSDRDDSDKLFIGQQGKLDGVGVIDIILKQPAAAQYIAAKLYRYFVNERLARDDEKQLGELLLNKDYAIDQFLKTLFLSREFYATTNRGSRIKSPAELMVSTYRHLRLRAIPGVPDFNLSGQALGQRLMHPPTVAGWSRGRSWITPSLMFERGNFALNVLFPDIGFVPYDRYPNFPSDEIVNVQDRLRQGMPVSEATKPTGISQSMMASSNKLADRDEDFNTRLGTMRGWQMAIERVKPIDRSTARLNLTQRVIKQQLKTPRAVFDYFVSEFFILAPDAVALDKVTRLLTKELGSKDVMGSQSFLEQPLRHALHQLLSLPEYQLG